jgi:hypothetical protein
MAGSLAAFTLVALTSEPDDPRLAPVFRSALVAPPSTVSSGASFSALVAPDSGVQVEDTTSSGATEGRLVLAKAVEAKPEAAVPLPAAAPSAKPRFVAAARTRTRGWATPSLAEPSNLEPEETSPAEGPNRLASGTSDASELLAKDTAFETPSSATRDAAVAPFAPKPKLILVAAAGPSPSAVTSLADLRRELRHEAESQATYSDGETLRGRRQVAFDVIRSRF